MSRFTKLSKTTAIEIEKEKSAFIVELQEGNTVPEIVINEMYYKDGEYKYCRGGVRIPYNADIIKTFMKDFNEVYALAKTIKPKASEVKTTKITDIDLSSLTPEQIAMLIAKLTATTEKKPEPKPVEKPKEPAKSDKTASDLELVLESLLLNSTKQKATKKSKK